MEKATVAGGCFWCLEQPFEELDGVHDVISGYTGGMVDNPTYEQVCTGKTGHYEAVQITYDPNVVSYEKLLETFWRQIDPTDPEGQFADRGTQYQTAIFYHDNQQQQIALQSKKKIDESGLFDKPVATKILPATKFYPAEAYHQDYYKTCSFDYKRYRYGSGRDSFLEKTWSK
ncbi:MAG: peptide-methionine (S)-S-oxide reductase MsrA [Candidatus Auribacterota bacterium]|nr:peptide-methionine (S)-S-oxide reductase MsrA [Candidatus Auribacterota bacterium]